MNIMHMSTLNNAEKPEQIFITNKKEKKMKFFLNVPKIDFLNSNKPPLSLDVGKIVNYITIK